MSNEMDNIITLQDEEGKDVRFEILDVFELEEREYFALIEADDEDSEEVLILKVIKDDAGDDMLEMIEDEEEIQKAFDYFVSRIAEDE